MEGNDNGNGVGRASARSGRSTPLRPSTQNGSRPGVGGGVRSGSSTPLRTRASADEAGMLRSPATAVAWANALPARNSVDVLPRSGGAGGIGLSMGMGGTASVGASVPLTATARPRFAAVHPKEVRSVNGCSHARA
eukprot:scaffold27749_cov17-Tisochrysis_lutea.AAC.1